MLVILAGIHVVGVHSSALTAALLAATWATCRKAAAGGAWKVLAGKSKESGPVQTNQRGEQGKGKQSKAKQSKGKRKRVR
jgi:membrane protein implicated in regulation of membrane protease activity